MMIFSLVAMIGLEECCITSAYLAWLCHSGERAVARGPLVIFIKKCCEHDSFNKCCEHTLEMPYRPDSNPYYINKYNIMILMEKYGSITSDEKSHIHSKTFTWMAHKPWLIQSCVLSPHYKNTPIFK